MGKEFYGVEKLAISKCFILFEKLMRLKIKYNKIFHWRRMNDVNNVLFFMQRFVGNISQWVHDR